MFENRVLRRILWPKNDEVTGDWGKLHNEGGEKIEKNEVAGACSMYGERRFIHVADGEI